MWQIKDTIYIRVILAPLLISSQFNEYVFRLDLSCSSSAILDHTVAPLCNLFVD